MNEEQIIISRISLHPNISMPKELFDRNVKELANLLLEHFGFKLLEETKAMYLIDGYPGFQYINNQHPNKGDKTNTMSHITPARIGLWRQAKAKAMELLVQRDVFEEDMKKLKEEHYIDDGYTDWTDDVAMETHNKMEECSKILTEGFLEKQRAILDEFWGMI